MKQFVAIFLTASVCWPTLAQDAIVPTEPARWTPELAMQFHSIDNPVFSPNGQWLAFTVREPIMEADKSEYLTHVHLVRSDGTGARQFTRGEKSSGSPQFSPDGSHLTFVREAGDKSQLWIIPIDGGEARQLTDSTNGVGSYRWSPDGSRIAFIMQEPDSDEEEKAKKEKSWVEREDQHFKYNHLHVLQVDDFESAESKQVTAGDFTASKKLVLTN